MTGKPSSGVNMPTVFVAAGVSAIISALIVSIGVVGVLFAVDSDNSGATAAQPTVVNLGSAANPQGTAPVAGNAQATSPAPAAPTTTTQAPAAAPAPVVGGGTSGGGGYAAPQSQAPAATQAPAAQQQVEAPAALSTDELNSKLKTVLNGSSGQKADELEGGAKAATVGEGIGNTLRAFEPVGLKWWIAGPVNVSGNTMTANLVLRSPGFNDATMGLTWVWKDGKWKLSNTSACEIAGYAQVPCSL
ncbi:MAG: hypothetical protein C0482_13305 [Gordonia sp.]|nr:hypothetical protein [Gordonia sp. (in: high G+C Gram-positive bacteria)]